MWLIRAIKLWNAGNIHTGDKIMDITCCDIITGRHKGIAKSSNQMGKERCMPVLSVHKIACKAACSTELPCIQDIEDAQGSDTS